MDPAGSSVFDAAGKLRLFVRYGSGAEALAADLKAAFRRLRGFRQAASARAARIFFIAATSIWRMRSALTP